MFAWRKYALSRATWQIVGARLPVDGRRKSDVISRRVTDIAAIVSSRPALNEAERKRTATLTVCLSIRGNAVGPHFAYDTAFGDAMPQLCSVSAS